MGKIKIKNQPIRQAQGKNYRVLRLCLLEH